MKSTLHSFVRHKREWRRVFLALLLLGLLVLLVSSDTLHGLLVDALHHTDRLIEEYPRWGALAFMALAAISAMLAFFSSAVLVPVGVSAWGTKFCLLLLWAGWVLGGMGTYALGRSAGRPLAASLSSWGAVSRYEDRISRHTPFWVVALFQAALPSEVPGYVLGIARYSFWKYLAVLALIELLWAVGTVYLSVGLLERRLTLIVALCLVGVGITVTALYFLLIRLRDDGGVRGCNTWRSRSKANASVGEIQENGDRSA